MNGSGNVHDYRARREGRVSSDSPSISNQWLSLNGQCELSNRRSAASYYEFTVIRGFK